MDARIGDHTVLKYHPKDLIFLKYLYIHDGTLTDNRVKTIKPLFFSSCLKLPQFIYIMNHVEKTSTIYTYVPYTEFCLETSLLVVLGKNSTCFRNTNSAINFYPSNPSSPCCSILMSPDVFSPPILKLFLAFSRKDTKDREVIMKECLFECVFRY